MTDWLDTLDSFLVQGRHEFFSRQQRQMSAQESLLYHYTTQAGLIGILRDKMLWASHIHYLNDHKEFWHTFDVAREELKDRSSRSNDRRIKEKLEALGSMLDRLVHTGVCVSSFSEDGDSLSQWRAYGGDGSGFAIGFSRSILEELATRNGFELCSCIYEPSAQTARVCEIVDSTMARDFHLGHVIGNPNSQTDNIAEPMDGDFMRAISSIAPLVKHQSFHEEREWRLVSAGGVDFSRLHHRPSKSMLIPYFGFPLILDGSVACVKRIIVGPTPHPELSERSLSSFLWANDFQPISPQITISQVPYRNW